MGLGCSRDLPDGISITVRSRCASECCSKREMTVYLRADQLQDVQAMLLDLKNVGVEGEANGRPSTRV